VCKGWHGTESTVVGDGEQADVSMQGETKAGLQMQTLAAPALMKL
jgi:hypothetical protein